MTVFLFLEVHNDFNLNETSFLENHLNKLLNQMNKQLHKIQIINEKYYLLTYSELQNKTNIVYNFNIKNNMVIKSLLQNETQNENIKFWTGNQK